MGDRPLVVQKFGGTSVGTVDRMRHVAEIVADERGAGNDVVVVVSAMSGETNRLIALAETATSDPSPREMDCLLATGEQVSVALLAMILNEMGVPARSILGFQMGMRTDSSHTKARILEIDRERFRRALDEGLVLVAAGFQGVDPEGDVTTLGRGGSDTTAVAIAAGLRADFCDIYTDVDGVYTADPNICSDARQLERISYEEMLELASSGAKVLQIRSVEMGMKYGVPLRVRSTFTRGPGTLVTREEPSMEGIVVAGVSCDRNEARIALRQVPDVPGIAAKIFTPLSKANIVVDMIIQNTSRDGSTDLTFTVPRTDLKQAMKLMQTLQSAVGIAGIEPDASIAKVSIVGVGMRSHAGVATQMFKVLADEGINIKMIATSEIKISAVIDEKYSELAVRALHRAFNLGAMPARAKAEPKEGEPRTERAGRKSEAVVKGESSAPPPAPVSRSGNGHSGRGTGRTQRAASRRGERIARAALGGGGNGKNGAVGIVHRAHSAASEGAPSPATGAPSSGGVHAAQMSRTPAKAEAQKRGGGGSRSGRPHRSRAGTVPAKKGRSGKRNVRPRK